MVFLGAKVVLVLHMASIDFGCGNELSLAKMIDGFCRRDDSFGGEWSWVIVAVIGGRFC